MDSPIVKVWRGKSKEGQFILMARTADGRRWIFSECGECSYWHETDKPYGEGEEAYDLNSTAFGVDDVRAM